MRDNFPASELLAHRELDLMLTYIESKTPALIKRKKAESMKIWRGAVLIAAAILAGCRCGDDGGASATPTFTIGG